MTTSSRDKWILSRAAPTLQELQGSTEKCHLDEAIVLCNYLNGDISPEAAARSITAAASLQNQLTVVCRIMTLLSETMMRFEQDSDMVLDLLVAIQNLPPTLEITWWMLPAFGSRWQHCYTSHRDVSSAAFYKKAGTLEAKMYLRGLYPVDDAWAFRALNVVCLEEPDLEVVIHEIHAWLDIAGTKMAENLQSTQITCYTRAMRARADKTYMIEATMYEHWEHWKKRFWQISLDEEFLSPEARLVAGRCHAIMKGFKIRPAGYRPEL